MKTEWTELMFMQIRAGNTAIYVFCLAILCVFLALAALYESWTLPLAVILVVPLCMLCSVAGVLLHAPGRRTSSCRSGWWCWSGWPARTPSWSSSTPSQLHEQGRPVFEATAGGVAAAAAADPDDVVRLHLRCVPLVLASGPGPRCGGRWAPPSSAACSA